MDTVSMQEVGLVALQKLIIEQACRFKLNDAVDCRRIKNTVINFFMMAV